MAAHKRYALLVTDCVADWPCEREPCRRRTNRTDRSRLRRGRAHVLCVLFVCAALVGCATPPATEQVQRGEPLNLLFILTDEQRFDTSAPYGNEAIETPNLNRLGKEGVVFERAYVTQPVCSPARASLLTGLWPHTNGVTRNNVSLPATVHTLPEMIPDSAYAAAYIGKWHLGRELDAWHGFDTRISIEDTYTRDDTTRFSDYHHWLRFLGYEPDDERGGIFSRDFAATLPSEHTKAKFVENQALRFLETHQDNPFLLYLGFLEPHEPNTGPFDALHDTSQVVLNKAHRRGLGHDQPLRHAIVPWYGPIDEPKNTIARYWGLVHQVDRSLGIVLNALDSLGLAENTIIVFTSEHGKMLGEYGMHGKTVMFDPSSRVPFFLRAPGVASRRISRPVSQIDVVPTLLDLLGREVPSHLQGKSLVSLMTGAPSSPDPVFLEWDWRFEAERALRRCPERATGDECIRAARERIRTVITPNGWKLNWSDVGRSELYDLDRDPLEMRNLYHDPVYADTVARLEQHIRDWQMRTHDMLALE